MKTLLCIMAFFCVIGLISGMSTLSRRGRNKFDLNRRGGKSMLEDFDEERKNLDNLMK